MESIEYTLSGLDLEQFGGNSTGKAGGPGMPMKALDNGA
jgi:hypothetical protein